MSVAPESRTRVLVCAALLVLASMGPANAQAPADAPALERPRIGLVLSGGGARGAAHVGVLKVLEELRVPIDAIAGTSMGAVVGGLYASGLSAAEIEEIMTSVDWQQAFDDRPPRRLLTFRRKQEDLNFLVRFPLGVRARRFLLPKGLIQGQALNQILRPLTMPVARITDFDELPTPFRAVATDLETGEAVVIGDGDLASAMRASVSAPGVFAPIERNGRLLVDGGLAENLPIEVARTMGVDRLIVVDVGFPLLERTRLRSAPIISNQMLAILIRRDSQRQRQTLAADDIVIDPPLGEASSFDFNRIEDAIEIGREAARASEARLAALALPPASHEQYASERARERAGTPPTIQFVRIDEGSQRYAEALEKRFAPVVGEPLDPGELAERVTLFYGQGNLETLDYQLVEDDRRYGLELSARRNSWGPNYVRFGLNLQDDFEGSSSYNAAARFTFAEITQPGGEWAWDLQIGENPRIATEVYLPLSQGPGFFVMPRAQYEARNLIVLADQVQLAEQRVRTFTYGLDFGREFSNWGEIRFGYGRASGRSRIRLGDPTLPVGEFHADEYFAGLTYDRLDDVNFPREGQTFTLQWDGTRFDNGPVETSERVSLNWLAAGSWGKQTAVFWASGGSTIGDASTDLRSLFTLGGFLNLSGLQPDSLVAPHFGIVRGLLYRQIGRAGPGFLDVPAYIGLSYELGNVWATRDEASLGSARRNGSLYVGLDTLLGPVYVATGFDEDGEQGFYLFLGRTF